MEYLLTAFFLIASFFCGWKCCRHWRSRPVPTPMQRALCAEQMRAYRAAVSSELQIPTK